MGVGVGKSMIGYKIHKGARAGQSWEAHPSPTLGESPPLLLRLRYLGQQYWSPQGTRSQCGVPVPTLHLLNTPFTDGKLRHREVKKLA